jgi:hypothetical protein
MPEDNPTDKKGAGWTAPNRWVTSRSTYFLFKLLFVQVTSCSRHKIRLPSADPRGCIEAADSPWQQISLGALQPVAPVAMFVLKTRRQDAVMRYSRSPECCGTLGSISVRCRRMSPNCSVRTVGQHSTPGSFLTTEPLPLEPLPLERRSLLGCGSYVWLPKRVQVSYVWLLNRTK